MRCRQMHASIRPQSADVRTRNTLMGCACTCRHVLPTNACIHTPVRQHTRTHVHASTRLCGNTHADTEGEGWNARRILCHALTCMHTCLQIWMERCSTFPCTDDGVADTSVAVALAVTFASPSHACASACIATCHPWRCCSGHCIAIHPDTLRLGVRFCGRSTPRIQGLVVADSIIHACMRYDVLLYTQKYMVAQDCWRVSAAGNASVNAGDA